MKSIKLNNKRLLLQFPTYREMNLSCFRITEFCEGPDSLKGKLFDAISFIDAYADSEGKLDYFYFWEGHNWSRLQMIEFVENEQKNGRKLSDREVAIVGASFDAEMDGNGYIISIVEGDRGTLRHELSHGLFFDNEEYRNSAIEILKKLGSVTYSKYRNCLINKNYNETVMLDEMQAYLVAWDEEEWEEQFSSISYSEIENQQKELSCLFDKHNTINNI